MIGLWTTAEHTKANAKCYQANPVSKFLEFRVSINIKHQLRSVELYKKKRDILDYVELRRKVRLIPSRSYKEIFHQNTNPPYKEAMNRDTSLVFCNKLQQDWSPKICITELLISPSCSSSPKNASGLWLCEGLDDSVHPPIKHSCRIIVKNVSFKEWE